MAENCLETNALKDFGSGPLLAACTSFRMEIKPATGKYLKGSSLNEDDFRNLLHGSDPVKIELDRLQNELRDKERVLADAHNEVKALRLTERVKEKAIAEVTEELEKTIEKLQACEAAVENKNLDLKRITDEKKAALAAQFAAEATLRRVHAAQKDEELPPLDAILSPLEAEIKILKQEIFKLQDDNKSLERITKSKESALLCVERDVQLANIKASLVDDLQNRNQELLKQIEMSQEEYIILDKIHRQKMGEMEKLGQTIHELEEALLSGATTANAARDYKRQVSELKCEKRTLERTLSRAKVKENRVALVVASEWKDANDKVMPIKHWLEERKVMMAEMQRLQGKLSTAVRAAKSEAKFKDILQLRLKVVEEAMKHSSHTGVQRSFNGITRCHSIGGDTVSRLSLTGVSKKQPHTPLLRSLTSSSSGPMLNHTKGASKSFHGWRLLDQDDGRTEYNNDMCNEEDSPSTSNSTIEKKSLDSKQSVPNESLANDSVPAVFYDLIQKEVISLRKVCNEKEQGLKDKDTAIEILTKKLDTLAKAMEVESKKMRREKTATDKELASARFYKEHDRNYRISISSSNGIGNHLQTHNRRNSTNK